MIIVKLPGALIQDGIDTIIIEFIANGECLLNKMKNKRSFCYVVQGNYEG